MHQNSISDCIFAFFFFCFNLLTVCLSDLANGYDFVCHSNSPYLYNLLCHFPYWMSLILRSLLHLVYVPLNRWSVRCSSPLKLTKLCSKLHATAKGPARAFVKIQWLHLVDLYRVAPVCLSFSIYSLPFFPWPRRYRSLARDILEAFSYSRQTSSRCTASSIVQTSGKKMLTLSWGTPKYSGPTCFLQTFKKQKNYKLHNQPLKYNMSNGERSIHIYRTYIQISIK